MKENENKEQSKTAGAARQGGDTSKETIGSPVSTAVGEPVALLQEVADVLAEQNWRGDLVERLRDAARLAVPTQAKPVDLSEIKVYGWTDEGMVVGEGRGKWCKFADVKRLSASKKAARIGCEGTGKSVGDMPCLGCDACPEFAAPTQVSAPQAVPEVLLNAKAVYDELYKTSSCSSLEEVSDVLDAIVRLIRADAPQASAAQEVRAVPKGWIAATYVKGELTSVAFRDRETAWACCAEGVPTAFYVSASTSTAPAAMDEVRNRALEEAAMVCDQAKVDVITKFDLRTNRVAGEIGQAIRALKTSQPSLDEVTGAGKGEEA